jgi:uncharacterized membrane protein YozB (DUF420 family)
MSSSILPDVNAILNSISATLIFIGYLMVRRKNVAAHRACMLGAFAASTLFLISYLTYHYTHGSKSFPVKEGFIRTVYLAILLSHTVLATAIVPLVLASIYRGLRGQFDKHMKVARWTFPLWLYVSITGVIVYLMLYQLYPSQGPQ